VFPSYAILLHIQLREHTCHAGQGDAVWIFNLWVGHGSNEISGSPACDFAHFLAACYQRFLIIGVAEFENKVKAMGQIKVDSIDDLKLGMEVRPSWESVRVAAGEDVFGLKFEPIS